jgi:signal transduction histidine kinase
LLHEFLTLHRDEIIARTRVKVAARTLPQPTDEELEQGIPVFLEQLADKLQRKQATPACESNLAMAQSAILHGGELFRAGLTIGQVVQDYGNVCQAITELAIELQSPISPDEFKTLNRCLDEAIAQAVTEYSRARDEARPTTPTETQRQGAFIHEVRNIVHNALIAYEVLKNGTVGIGGSTGAILGRNLVALRDLVARSAAEIRLEAGLVRRERVPLLRFIEEAASVAMIEAKTLGHELTVTAVEPGVEIDVDQHLITAAITNLIQNAFKFTPCGGHIVLRADVSTSAGRVLIEVEDECGGLPAGASARLFHPFEHCSSNRSGLGLGLTIVRKSVAANSGEVRVRNLPGKGCIFTIDLPRADSGPASRQSSGDNSSAGSNSAQASKRFVSREMCCSPRSTDPVKVR